MLLCSAKPTHQPAWGVPGNSSWVQTKAKHFRVYKTLASNILFKGKRIPAAGNELEGVGPGVVGLRRFKLGLTTCRG